MYKQLSIVFCVCLLAATLHANDRILAFGDSNTWGWKPNGGGERYDDAVRWTGVLQSQLGEGFEVVTDGLVARRTDLDGLDAGLVSGSFLNGAKTLPAAIARNAPLDLVILFLGTNDVQLGAERSAEEVAQAVAGLAELALKSERLLYANYPAPPKVLIVVPPALRDLETSPLKGLFSVGFETSQEMEAAFRGLDPKEGVDLIYFDQITPDGIGGDGIHLNEIGHLALGEAIAEWVKRK